MTSTAVASRDDATKIEGWWLKEAMAEADVSSAALARRLEVDGTTIYRWRESSVDGEGGGISKLNWYACLMALGLAQGWKPERLRERETKRSKG